jgi:hypothetical protein
MPLIRLRHFGIIIIVLMILSACNLPQKNQVATTDPSLIHTAAALTVQAQINQGGINTPLPTVQPGSTQISPSVPTSTNVPPTPTPPLATSTSPGTTPVVPCDRAAFVEDVTYPDDTVVSAGTNFIKTWRLKNSGSCTWTSNYSVVFQSGNAMGAPASSALTTVSVAPDQVMDLSLSFRAPLEAGTYRGEWKLRNGAGTIFGTGTDGEKPFWVQIKVVVPGTPTPTPTQTPVVTVGFDFISRGPDAEWRNATSVIAWGDPVDDSPGVAVDLRDIELENDRDYDRVLATYPEKIEDGRVSGLYPNYSVQNGDHFRALLGFRNSCGIGKVRYQLNYVENGVESSLGEWLKVCDGTLLSIDRDLSGLQGKTVQFKLIVKADGAYNDDKAIWVNPRIER